MGRLIDADDVKKMISDTFEKEKDVINEKSNPPAMLGRME